MKKKSVKLKKISKELQASILDLLSQKKYKPVSIQAFLKKLHIPPAFLKIAKEIIQTLNEKKTISLKNNKISLIPSKKEKKQTVIGTLCAHPRGFGFVEPQSDEKIKKDIFIPRSFMDGAIHGDIVEVEIEQKKISTKGPEGKIVAITERTRKHLVGIIENASNGFYEIYVPLLGTEKKVILKKRSNKLKVGDRLLLAVDNWCDKNQKIVTSLIQNLGNISDASQDMAVAIEEYSLQKTFPQKVIKEAKNFGTRVTKNEMATRKDFSKLECVTIDPETARDFDDAISLTKDAKGHYHLGVHIADVAHYITPESSLDNEAIIRGNSTYFPSKSLPMLPEELSSHLCSLKPNVIRLTASVIMHFDNHGVLKHYEMHRSFIKSQKRFSYEEAKKVLDKKKKSKHLPLLQNMMELCLLLKEMRKSRGSMDFSLPEAAIKVDKNGEPQGIVIHEYDITHQMIEEFMLKANEMIAFHLTEQEKKLIYRIHEEPAAESINKFYDFARVLGFFLPQNPTFKDVQKIFQETGKKAQKSQLFTRFIRSMRLACYSPHNLGHYGLALEHYCHFTSPIRRYSDLISQRLLFHEQPKETDYKKIARHCSDTERNSAKAENSVRNLKKIRLLKKYFDEDPYECFDATIIDVKHYGLTFQITSLFIEGFIHISEIGNDYYIFNDRSLSLIGDKTKETFSLGDHIQVMITDINLIHAEVTFVLLPRLKKRKKK